MTGTTRGGFSMPPVRHWIEIADARYVNYYQIVRDRRRSLIMNVLSPTSRIRASICANQTDEDIEACVLGGADAVGVLVQVRHRAEDAVDLATARRLLASVPPYVGRYAVTHAEDLTDLLQLTTIPLDTIQLHGSVSKPTVERFRESAPHIRVLKTVHVVDQIEPKTTAEWEVLVDGFVVDSVNLLEDRIGGTGMTHDWSISAKIVSKSSLPVILAGGLRPDNVHDAVRVVHPWGVNVNSGVERSHAKDPQLVQAFVRRANADFS
jgi:phosphoribosylanthranilate isomerase